MGLPGLAKPSRASPGRSQSGGGLDAGAATQFVSPLGRARLSAAKAGCALGGGTVGRGTAANFGVRPRLGRCSTKSVLAIDETVLSSGSNQSHRDVGSAQEAISERAHQGTHRPTPALPIERGRFHVAAGAALPFLQFISAHASVRRPLSARRRRWKSRQLDDAKTVVARDSYRGEPAGDWAMRTSAPQPLVRALNSLAVLPARVVGVPGQTDVNAIRRSVRLGPGGYGFRGPESHADIRRLGRVAS